MQATSRADQTVHVSLSSQQQKLAAAMDLSAYRNGEREQERVADLMQLLPEDLETAIDIGARDGFISKLLAHRISRVTALDLECPVIDHDRIECLQGDVTSLHLPDSSFDLVVCTEVLEHIPTKLLAKACAELSRISKRFLLIGVPFKQDIRVGRTTCAACGTKNPPWGHLNSFDERKLQQLFSACEIAKRSFVGVADAGTNALSCFLMDLAGNPYGTYSQDETCISCGGEITRMPHYSVPRKMFARAAVYCRNLQAPFVSRHPNWIHLLFEIRSP